MKEMNDDELQQWLDGKPTIYGNVSPNDDAEAYRNLFEALDKEPEKGLSYNFAVKVARKITAEQKRNNELKLNLIAVAIIMALVALACGLLTLLKTDIITKLPPYKWVIVFGPIVFIGIQYFDQKLVKSNIFRKP
jgi:Na+/glutamate symporter